MLTIFNFLATRGKLVFKGEEVQGGESNHIPQLATLIAPKGATVLPKLNHIHIETVADLIQLDAIKRKYESVGIGVAIVLAQDTATIQSRMPIHRRAGYDPYNNSINEINATGYAETDYINFNRKAG